MSVTKKQLLVLVIKEKELSIGIYIVNKKIPQLVSYQEQFFSEDLFQQGYLFNIPLFVDFIQHFLVPHKQAIPTIICFDEEKFQEGIYLKKEKIDKETTEKKGIKTQTVQFPLCCYAMQQTYMRQLPYSVLIQYTLVLTLLRCPLVSILSPLLSLIYFNHQYGGKQHQLIEDDYQKIRTFLETRSFSLLRNELSKMHNQNNQTLLSLYSLTAAYVGTDK